MHQSIPIQNPIIFVWFLLIILLFDMIMSFIHSLNIILILNPLNFNLKRFLKFGNIFHQFSINDLKPRKTHDHIWNINSSIHSENNYHFLWLNLICDHLTWHATCLFHPSNKWCNQYYLWQIFTFLLNVFVLLSSQFWDKVCYFFWTYLRRRTKKKLSPIDNEERKNIKNRRKNINFENCFWLKCWRDSILCVSLFKRLISFTSHKRVFVFFFRRRFFQKICDKAMGFLFCLSIFEYGEIETREEKNVMMILEKTCFFSCNLKKMMQFLGLKIHSSVSNAAVDGGHFFTFEFLYCLKFVDSVRIH